MEFLVLILIFILILISLQRIRAVDQFEKTPVILSVAKNLQFPSASDVRGKPKMEILRYAQNDSGWNQTDPLPGLGLG